MGRHRTGGGAALLLLLPLIVCLALAKVAPQAQKFATLTAHTVGGEGEGEGQVLVANGNENDDENDAADDDDDGADVDDLQAANALEQRGDMHTRASTHQNGQGE